MRSRGVHAASSGSGGDGRPVAGWGLVRALGVAGRGGVQRVVVFSARWLLLAPQAAPLRVARRRLPVAWSRKQDNGVVALAGDRPIAGGSASGREMSRRRAIHGPVAAAVDRAALEVVDVVLTFVVSTRSRSLADSPRLVEGGRSDSSRGHPSTVPIVGVVRVGVQLQRVSRSSDLGGPMLLALSGLAGAAELCDEFGPVARPPCWGFGISRHLHVMGMDECVSTFGGGVMAMIVMRMPFATMQAAGRGAAPFSWHVARSSMRVFAVQCPQPPVATRLGAPFIKNMS